MWIFAHRFHAEFIVATILAPFVLRAPRLRAADVPLDAARRRVPPPAVRTARLRRGVRNPQRRSSPRDGRRATSIPSPRRCTRRLDRIRGAARDLGRRRIVFLQAVVCVPPDRRGGRRPDGAEPRRRSVRAIRRRSRASSQGQRHVARDEARHIGIGVSYVRQRMAEDRERTHRGDRRDRRGRSPSLSTSLLETALTGGMDTQVLAGYGVEARGLLRRGHAALADAAALDRPRGRLELARAPHLLERSAAFLVDPLASGRIASTAGVRASARSRQGGRARGRRRLLAGRSARPARRLSASFSAQRLGARVGAGLGRSARAARRSRRRTSATTAGETEQERDLSASHSSLFHAHVRRRQGRCCRYTRMTSCSARRRRSRTARVTAGPPETEGRRNSGT